MPHWSLSFEMTHYTIKIKKILKINLKLSIFKENKQDYFKIK